MKIKNLVFCFLCLTISSFSYAKSDVKTFARKIASAGDLNQLSVAGRLSDLEQLALLGLQQHEDIASNPKGMEKIYSKQALCYQIGMAATSIRILATIGDPSLKGRLDKARASHLQLVDSFGCQ